MNVPKKEVVKIRIEKTIKIFLVLTLLLIFCAALALAVNELVVDAATGNVGIGTSSPGEKLDVVGDLRLTNFRTRTMNRALPTTVDDAVDIGNFTFTNGAGALWISVSVPSTAFSVSKEYLLPVQYDQTAGAWTIANPISSTGKYSLNDFELDIKVSASITSLRLRRTEGSTAGTAYIVIKQEGVNTNSFTSSTDSGSVSAPSSFFEGAVLTQVDGNVGIGTDSPGAKLHTEIGNGEGGASRLIAKFFNTASTVGGLYIHVGPDAELGLLTFGVDIAATNIQPLSYASTFTGSTDHAGRAASILAMGGGGFSFQTIGPGTGTSSHLVTMLEGGNVGINTSTPQNTLNVVGDANITGTLYVNENSVSDTYVPYTGALRNVELGANDFSVDGGAFKLSDNQYISSSTADRFDIHYGDGLGLDYQSYVRFIMNGTNHFSIRPHTSGVQYGTNWVNYGQYLDIYTDNVRAFTLGKNSFYIRGQGGLTQILLLGAGSWTTISALYASGIMDFHADKEFNFDNDTNIDGDLNVTGNISTTELCLTGDTCRSTWPTEGGGGGGTGIWNRSGTNVFLNNTGDNVGIGTSSPSSKLEIVDSVGDLSGIDISNQTGNMRARLKYSLTNGGYLLLLNESESSNVMLRAYGDSYFTGGYVGIGTGSPERTLSFQTLDYTNADQGILFMNTGADVSDAIVQPWEFGAGVGLVLGANVYVNTSGDFVRFDTAEESSAILLDPRGEIYFSNSGTGANPTTKMTILDDGNVGIGTVSPSELLEVSKSQNASTRIKVTNLNSGALANAGFRMESDGGVAILYKTSNAYTPGSSTIQDATVLQDGSGGDIVLYGAAEIARFENAGNVGIGTIPDQLLHLSNSFPQIKIDGTTASGYIENWGRGVVTIANAYYDGAWKRDTAGYRPSRLSLDSNAQGSDRAFSLSTGTDVATPVWTERFTILHNGKVGIGTDAPTTFFELNSPTNPVQMKIVNTNPSIAGNIIDIIAQSKNDAEEITVLYIMRGSMNNRTNGSEETTIDFQTLTGGVRTDRLTIKGNKVGIGTGEPSHELNVVGDANVTGTLYADVTGDLTGTASDLECTDCVGTGDLDTDYISEAEMNTLAEWDTQIQLTGTQSNANFLRGDGAWTTGYLDADGSDAVNDAVYSEATIQSVCTLCIGDAQIVQNSIDGSEVAADAFDFVDFQDTLDLDATLTWNTGSYDINIDSNTLFIDGSANKVGIGTTIPGAPLSFGSSIGNKIFLYESGSTTYGLGIQSNLLQIFSHASTSDIALGYGNSSSFTENMRIKGNGNVGIGTDSPLAKLEVRGEVRTTDSSGNPRLWGEGRPAVSASSECTVGDLNVGRGSVPVSWGAASAGCPEGTWVCTYSERGAGVSGSGIMVLWSCGGTLDSSVNAWVSDCYNTGGACLSGYGMASPTTSGFASYHVCDSKPVWCCWD